jgi:hypothetical protein
LRIVQFLIPGWAASSDRAVDVAEEAAVGDVSADAVANWFQGPSGPIFWEPSSIAIDVHAYRILLTSVCPYDIHYEVQKIQYRDSGARRATWQIARRTNRLPCWECLLCSLYKTAARSLHT